MFHIFSALQNLRLVNQAFHFLVQRYVEDQMQSLTVPVNDTVIFEIIECPCTSKRKVHGSIARNQKSTRVGDDGYMNPIEIFPLAHQVPVFSRDTARLHAEKESIYRTTKWPVFCHKVLDIR